MKKKRVGVNFYYKNYEEIWVIPWQKIGCMSTSISCKEWNGGKNKKMNHTAYYSSNFITFLPFPSIPPEHNSLPKYEGVSPNLLDASKAKFLYQSPASNTHIYTKSKDKTFCIYFKTREMSELWKQINIYTHIGRISNWK